MSVILYTGSVLSDSEGGTSRHLSHPPITHDTSPAVMVVFVVVGVVVVMEMILKWPFLYC